MKFNHILTEKQKKISKVPPLNRTLSLYKINKDKEEPAPQKAGSMRIMTARNRFKDQNNENEDLNAKPKERPLIKNKQKGYFYEPISL